MSPASHDVRHAVRPDFDVVTKLRLILDYAVTNQLVTLNRRGRLNHSVSGTGFTGKKILPSPT